MRPRNSSSARANALAALFVAGLAIAAGGIITNDWIGGDAGDFNDPMNWSAGAPSSGQALTIIQSGPLNATLSADLVADSLTIYGDPGDDPAEVELDMMGHSMTLESLVDPLKIAETVTDSIGALTLKNGHLGIATDALLRFDVGSLQLADGAFVTTGVAEFHGPDSNDPSALRLSMFGEDSGWASADSFTMRNATLAVHNRAFISSPDIELANVRIESVDTESGRPFWADYGGFFLGDVRSVPGGDPTVFRGIFHFSEELSGPTVFEIPFVPDSNPYGGSTPRTSIVGSVNLSDFVLAPYFLTPDPTPYAGTSYLLIVAFDLVGQFGEVRFPDLDALGFPDLGWRLDYQINEYEDVDYLYVDIVPRCEGDVDYNGRVSMRDIADLLARWGPADDSNARFDLDGSGAIDAADLAVLLGNWGACP